jgi:hypothetical protein
VDRLRLRVDMWLSWFHPYGVGSRGIESLQGPTSSIRVFWFLLDLLAILAELPAGADLVCRMARQSCVT